MLFYKRNVSKHTVMHNASLNFRGKLNFFEFNQSLELYMFNICLQMKLMQYSLI